MNDQGAAGTETGGAQPRRRIVVLAFSPLARDGRVLRQAEYLSRDFDVVVVGWGPLPPPRAGVRWLAVAEAGTRAERAAAYALLLAGRAVPAAYDAWFQARSYHRETLRALAGEEFAAVLANDWTSLPVGAELARRAGARLVFDAHEFAPLEWEDSWRWRETYAPLIRHTLRRYAARCDASVTVAAQIADRYRREFGLDPLVVLNAPQPVALPARPAREAGAPVRVIHHGAAIRTRRLELMIEAVALAGPRFTLAFMLVGDESYIAELGALAEARAPGRVRFLDPVPPGEIVERVAGYDLGLFLLEPTVYNYAMALPNKFFDYVSAGLPVCIGPSPAMAGLALEHGFGCVARGFTPRDVADALNGIDEPALERMRGAARAAARTLNADVEMGKLVALFHRLLGDPPAGAHSIPTSGDTR